MDSLLDRARRIRLLVLDVDGVLTDGRIYMSPDGEELKVFDVRDGAGIAAIRRAGIDVAIISGRSSTAVDRRAAELGIERVLQGVRDKGAAFAAVLDDMGATAEQTACVGDDVVDLPMMQRSGLAIAVADAHVDLRKAADFVTSLPGGRGAVREVCDLLLTARR